MLRLLVSQALSYGEIGNEIGFAQILDTGFNPLSKNSSLIWSIDSLIVTTKPFILNLVLNKVKEQ